MSEDRRVSRTEKALKEAMVTLLSQKVITKITIKELCEVADINRGTFYAHYTDQYALLNAIINEIAENINAFVDKSAKQSDGDGSDAYRTVKRVFEYVRSNTELCRVLLSGNIKLDLSDLVIEFMAQRGMFNLEKYKIEKQKLNQYICSFIANGSLGIFKEWIDSGMKESNEAMAKILINLVITGLSEFIRE